MNSQPPWVNHHGAVIHREEQEASPPATVDRGESESPRPVKCRLCFSSWPADEVECAGALRLEALNDQAALGFRRSVGDEVAETDLCNPGMIRLHWASSPETAVCQPSGVPPA